MSRWQELWQQRNSYSYRRPRLSHRRKIIKSKFFARLALFCFIGLISLGFLTTGLFAFYAKDLPQPDKIIRREGFSTKIYDRNGGLLYDIFANQKKTPVDLKDVPQHLRNA